MSSKMEMGIGSKNKVRNSEPEVIRLTNLVDYEAASTANRAIIEKKAAAVAAFAL
jgi:hypothetical protein